VASDFLKTLTNTESYFT